MAAYAALNSVMSILQQIKDDPRPPITIQKQHMDSLCEIISFLQDFLEKYSHRYIADDREALESRIAYAAYAAEDIIDPHIVDQIRKEDAGKTTDDIFYQVLQKLMGVMDSMKKEAIKIQEKARGIDDDRLPINIIGSSTVTPPKRKHTNIMVGFDDVLEEILEWLTRGQNNRQVLPIVGMGGIGKTTLATHAYDKVRFGKHFDIQIWITISQKYKLRDILLQALSEKDENKDTRDDELGLQLHQRLSERRYLIVLDDMWSIEAWEKLMLFFPDNNNGSRIMITTRLSKMSDHFGSCGFHMRFLDEDKSWNLFCKVVFPKDQRCPPELEKIGMEIARNCKGLPLSIAVIGGLLAKTEKTRHHWKYIAENLNRIINSEDDNYCSNILYLSYNHLPTHLKPCFLYMGYFREDEKIDVPWLKRLWVAEGFLKPNAKKSLEVVAEEYFNYLIDRNLILVHKLGRSGKVKYCKIHDLLRDLCLTEAKKDKFLWERDFDNLKGIQSQRRINFDYVGGSNKFHIDRVLEALPSASLARSLIRAFGIGGRPLSHNFRLVRVCSMKVQCEYMVENISELVNSRFLEFYLLSTKPNIILPSSIHLLWNLQTLIIRSGCSIMVPPQIWKMSHLRHLQIKYSFSLPDPPNDPLIHEGDDDGFIFKNLHTLKRVRNLRLSEEAIKRIPNIKKLGVSFNSDDHNYCPDKLYLLNKLESVECSFDFLKASSPEVALVKNIVFPRSLKKLRLKCPYLHWEDMTMIGSLPHLRLLKLHSIGLHSGEREWNPVEGHFLSLEVLQVHCCYDLVCWNANSTHFPCLEKLVLKRLDNLREIPLDMGQISTLESIEVWCCSDSAVMSAKNILDEQVELGNENLQVRVSLVASTLELGSLGSHHNFQVKDYRRIAQLKFIKDVTPKTRSWSVKVRVEEKQMPRQSQSSPRRYQRLVLVDGLGMRVAATIFESDIELFKQSFQLHKTYVISEAKVTLVDIEYWPFDNQFQWTINRTTAVRLEQNSVVPRSVFMPSYVPFAEFANYIGTRQPIDIIAVVIEKLRQRTITINGKKNIIQDFAIINPEMQPCVLTLWNDLALNEGEAINNSADTMPVIVATRLATSSYLTISLGSTAYSSITVDPSIPEAHNLKAWRSNNHSQLASIFKEQAYLLRNATAINLTHDQCLSIVEAVKDNNLQKFTVLVKVRIRDLLQKFYYMSCPKCYASTVAEYNWKFHCMRCGEIVQAKPREKLTIDIYDQSGDLDVITFGKSASTLFEINAFDRMKRDNQGEVNTLQKLQNEEFLMKISKKVRQTQKKKHEYLTSPSGNEICISCCQMQYSEQLHLPSMPSKKQPLNENAASTILNYDERMFIADAIKDNDLHNFTVFVKVQILDSTQKCFYMACQECYETTTNEYNVKYKCADCGKAVQAKPREKLCINIYDNSGAMDIVLFGDLAVALLDMNAFTCMEMSNEGQEIRIDSINSKFENQLFLMKISKSLHQDSNEASAHYMCVACGRYQLQNIRMPLKTTCSPPHTSTHISPQLAAKGKQIADSDDVFNMSEHHTTSKIYTEDDIATTIPIMKSLQSDDPITYEKNNEDL